jgi:hypothetical protein
MLLLGGAMMATHTQKTMPGVGFLFSFPPPPNPGVERRDRGFADSPLEESGYELLIPLRDWYPMAARCPAICDGLPPAQAFDRFREGPRVCRLRAGGSGPSTNDQAKDWRRSALVESRENLCGAPPNGRSSLWWDRGFESGSLQRGVQCELIGSDRDSRPKRTQTRCLAQLDRAPASAPGKTTRLVETHSPVDAILAARGAKHVNVNLPRYFS